MMEVRNTALLADQAIRDQAAKISALQGVTDPEAIEATWESLEQGLLQFVITRDRVWVEPCGASPQERAEAVKRTRALLRCRKPC
jgi:hypothetical protein